MFNKKNTTKKLTLLSIKDLVADEFGPLFTAVTIGVGLRSYREFMKDVPYKHEYALYHIGTMDSDMKITSDVYVIDLLNTVATLPEDHPNRGIAEEIIESQKRSIGMKGRDMSCVGSTDGIKKALNINNNGE